MRGKLKHIIEGELDWVKNVNEHDNFFDWFRSKKGPSHWIGRDIQWWIDHTQDVEYAMSAIHMDVSEMLKYTDKISDGKANAQTTLENLSFISEYVLPTYGRNDIERYILDIQEFTKEFRQYFGEDMTLSDMVESVGLALMYGQENNINIHYDKNDSMHQQIMGEDFDWAINDTVSFLEIGEPLSVQQPKNKYKLHVEHGVGEDNGMWVPNWNTYDPTTQLEHLVRNIKIVSYLQQGNSIWDLATLWAEGETWVLSDEVRQNIKNEFGDYNEDAGLWEKESEEFDVDEVRDVVWEWLNDELMDYGLREHDSYHQEDATIEDWKVTYFDEFGVEHAVKVNLPQG
jgi:hypothetical protein